MPQRRDRTILLGGVAVFLIHLAEELIVHRPPGVTAGRDAPDLAYAAGLSVIVTIAVLRAPAPVRSVCVAALALVVGTISASEGATHAVEAYLTGLGAADVTGLAELISGLALVGLALGITVRVVRSAPTRPRRWARGLTGAATLTMAGLFVVLPIAGGAVQARIPRRPMTAPPASSFEPVTLTTDDGLRLRGWYSAARNDAAVMVLNSSRGDHEGSRDHALLLASQGYGVLVYDARGSGGSEGEPNGWGWGWTKDVDAGVDFLTAREDVRDGRVALLGLSTGADVAIQAAAEDKRIRAVVADGATATQFADRPAGVLSVLSTWPMFGTAALLSAMEPGLPLAPALRQVTSPVLLIASGSLPAEIPLNERYAAQAGCNVTLWTLPDVDHVNAVDEVAPEYDRRLEGFLRSALQSTASPRTTRASTGAPSCDQ